MIRRSSVLASLLVMYAAAPVSADTVTFVDSTDSLSVVTSGSRAIANAPCTGETCSAVIAGPTGAVSFQAPPNFFIADPDGVTISDRIFGDFAPVFISDGDAPGGLGLCSTTGSGSCDVIENGQVQLAYTVSWFDNAGRLLATDQVFFQSDVDSSPVPEPSVLLLLGSGVAAIGVAWRRGQGPPSSR